VFATRSAGVLAGALLIIVGCPTTADDDTGDDDACVSDDDDATILDIEQAALSIEGPVGNGRFGWFLAGDGDADNDGLSEILVAAPYLSHGVVYRFTAPFDGDIGSDDAVDTFHGGTLEPISVSYTAGRGVAWLHDAATGRDRVLVGNDPDWNGGKALRADEDDVSACYLASGTETGLLEDVSVPVLHDGALPDIVGTTGSKEYVVGAGDLDGDGAADVVVGNGDRATVWILDPPSSQPTYLGDARTVLTSEQYRGAGASLATGNQDMDEADELLIGAPLHANRRGACFVVDQPGEGNLDLADSAAILLGGAAEDYAGSAVAFAGDIDGDSIGDVLVGAPSAETAEDVQWQGVVYLLSGPLSGEIDLGTDGVVLRGEIIDGEGYQAGSAVAGAGDVNGDGFGDVLVGAPRGAHSSAYLLHGPLCGVMNLVDADVIFRAANDHDDLGTSLAHAGDLDGDGLDDFLIGAPGWDDRGKVYVVAGGGL